jgi:hypothetical protein
MVRHPHIASQLLAHEHPLDLCLLLVVEELDVVCASLCTGRRGLEVGGSS